MKTVFNECQNCSEKEFKLRTYPFHCTACQKYYILNSKSYSYKAFAVRYLLTVVASWIGFTFIILYLYTFDHLAPVYLFSIFGLGVMLFYFLSSKYLTKSKFAYMEITRNEYESKISTIRNRTFLIYKLIGICILILVVMRFYFSSILK